MGRPSPVRRGGSRLISSTGSPRARARRGGSGRRGDGRDVDGEVAGRWSPLDAFKRVHREQLAADGGSQDRAEGVASAANDVWRSDRAVGFRGRRVEDLLEQRRRDVGEAARPGREPVGATTGDLGAQLEAGLPKPVGELSRRLGRAPPNEQRGQDRERLDRAAPAGPDHCGHFSASQSRDHVHHVGAMASSIQLAGMPYAGSKRSPTCQD